MLAVAAVIAVLVSTKDPVTRPQVPPVADVLPSWPSGPVRVEPAPTQPSAIVADLPQVTGQAVVPEDTSRPARTTTARRTSAPAQNATAYRTTQAEEFDEQNGITVEADQTGPGRHVGFITTGDWVRYDNVGFTDVPATTLLISASNWAANNGTGEVELHLDNRSSAPIGTMTIPNNADWFTFTAYSMKIQPTTGVHTVYLTFTSKQTEEFGNVDWFRFQH
ncbi:hypothetical protein BJ973_004153 [Actinoplanes tereljensis]|uniref:carbohydrate-binding protein n=1 Tax=Paractinoplanes tereljensis TaxID=571912 RepID=UPI001941C1D5|nr:carbohydrate-binding protein [Actinoplanes tereljensis]